MVWGEFEKVVEKELGVDGFGEVYVVLVIVVDGLGEYVWVGERVGRGFVEIVENVGEGVVDVVGRVGVVVWK